MEDVIEFVSSNYTWLIPAVFTFCSFLVVLFKKGGVSKEDAVKILANEQLLAEALTVLMEKENKKKNEVSSETKQTKA